jgi:hypothetical protein
VVLIATATTVRLGIVADADTRQHALDPAQHYSTRIEMQMNCLFRTFFAVALLSTVWLTGDLSILH